MHFSMFFWPRFQVYFGVPFFFKIEKLAFWKSAFRLRHPSKIEPRESNWAFQNAVKKSLKKWSIFGPFWGAFWDPKINVFLIRFLASVLLSCFFHFSKTNHENWARACTPGAYCCFRLVEKCVCFLHLKNQKLHSRAGASLIFECLQSPKSITFFYLDFLDFAFRLHERQFFSARGSQND